MADDDKGGIRLVILLVVVLLAVGAASFIWYQRQDRSGLNPELPPVSTGTVTPPADGPAGAAPGAGGNSGGSGNGNSFGGSPVQGPELEDAKRQAIAFSTAFFSTSYNSDQEMVASVGRFATSGLRARLGDVDYTKIPSYKTTDRSGVFSRGSNDALIDVVLTSPGGLERTARMYLVRSGSSWLVDDYGMRGGVR